MPDRVFTAHVELVDGKQSTFKVDAPTIREAHRVAQEQLDDGEILARRRTARPVAPPPLGASVTQ